MCAKLNFAIKEMKVTHIQKYLSYKYLNQGLHQVWYQGILKATVSGVLEDLTFKISEGSDQN